MGKKTIAVLLGIFMAVTTCSCGLSKNTAFSWSSDEYNILRVYQNDERINCISCMKVMPPNDDVDTMRIGDDKKIVWKISRSVSPVLVNGVLCFYDKDNNDTELFELESGKMLAKINGKVEPNLSDDDSLCFLTNNKKTSLVKTDLSGMILWESEINDRHSDIQASLNDKIYLFYFKVTTSENDSEKDAKGYNLFF